MSPADNGSPPPGALLTFEAASFAPNPRQNAGCTGISLQIREGDCVLIRLQSEHLGTPLPDASQGLAVPETGRVLWKGMNWTDMKPWQAARTRGSMGRLFAGHAWISNLTVYENVLLRHMHHAQMTRSEVEGDAAGIVRAFGAESLPRIRPALLPRRELQIAQCVRAFTGRPELILLEQPAEDLYDSDVEALLQVVADARFRGAGVLWITRKEAIWAHDGPRPSLRLRAEGQALVADVPDVT